MTTTQIYRYQIEKRFRECNGCIPFFQSVKKRIKSDREFMNNWLRCLSFSGKKELVGQMHDKIK